MTEPSEPVQPQPDAPDWSPPAGPPVVLPPEPAVTRGPAAPAVSADPAPPGPAVIPAPEATSGPLGPPMWPPVAATTGFAQVRARWLLLVAVLGGIAVIALGALLVGTGGAAVADELVATLLYVPLVVWAVVVAARHRIRLRAFFNWPRIGRYWFVVLGMGLALFVFSLGASAVTAAMFPDYVAGAEISTSSGAVILAITIAMVPPVVEEFIFRGMLLERWAVKWRLGTAVVVQAICFGILHVDPLGAGVFGVVMALLYLRTRSLWAPIIVHAINNGVVLVFVFLSGSGAAADTTPQPAEQALVGLFFMAVALPFIALFVYRNWPGPDDVTPYEEYELGAGALPPRRLGRANIGGQSLYLRLDPSALIASTDRGGRAVVWRIPYTDLAGMAVTADWRHVELSGAGTVRIEMPQRTTRARIRAVHAMAMRAQRYAGVEVGWAG